MTPTDIAKLSLAQIGARTTSNNIFDPDGTAETTACAQFYTPVVQAVLRSAHWNCARRQVFPTLYKAVYLNGVLQTGNNAPPTPWTYEYLLPADCLKVRFVLNTTQQATVSPPLTTGNQSIVPTRFAGFARFTPAMDVDPNNNPIKVLLTYQNQAQMVYTADISQTPDLWDAQLTMAVWSTLATFLVNPLARNEGLFKSLTAVAAGAVASARATDGNEQLPSQDHVADWIRVRSAGGYGGGWGNNGNGMFCAGWDSLTLGSGVSF